MKLFLDTEFNSWRGDLISIALVPEDKSVAEFYFELEIDYTSLDPWVKENVIPHLTQDPVSKEVLQGKLQNYLNMFHNITIVADWPTDIEHLMDMMTLGPGLMISLNDIITFELDSSISYNSKVPHHALHDARAIRDSYIIKKHKGKKQ